MSRRYLGRNYTGKFVLNQRNCIYEKSPAPFASSARRAGEATQPNPRFLLGTGVASPAHFRRFDAAENAKVSQKPKRCLQCSGRNSHKLCTVREKLAFPKKLVPCEKTSELPKIILSKKLSVMLPKTSGTQRQFRLAEISSLQQMICSAKRKLLYWRRTKRAPLVLSRNKAIPDSVPLLFVLNPKEQPEQTREHLRTLHHNNLHNALLSTPQKEYPQHDKQHRDYKQHNLQRKKRNAHNCPKKRRQCQTQPHF